MTTGHRRKIEEGGVLRGSLVTSLWTLVSRLLGFVRDMLMTSILGMGVEFGAFAFAWVVPNLFRRLFGEGAVGAVIQPALARAAQQDGDDAARRLYTRFFGWIALGLIVLVVVGEVLLFARLESLDIESESGMMVFFTILLLPYALFICLAALATAPQHLHGRFFAPAAAPVLLNLVWIGGLVWFGSSQVNTSREVLVALCISILGAGLLQLLVQLPGVRAAGFPLRPRIGFEDGSGRRAVRAFLPALLGLAAVQINMAIDQSLVWSLVGHEANSFCYLANRLLQLPLALVAISIATAAMPLFSNLAAAGEHERMSLVLGRACEASFLLIVAAAAGLAVLAPQVISTLFDHGAYDSTDTPLLSLTLRTYLLCLPAAALSGLLTRVRQARGDYRRPALAALISLPVNLGLDLVLLPRIGVPGAGIATAVALTVQVMVLLGGLKTLGLRAPISLGRLPRLVLPGAAAAGAAGGLSYVTGTEMLALHPWLSLLLAILAGVIAALLVCRLLLPEELKLLRGRGANLLGSKKVIL